MARITSLTDEQKAKFPEYVETWSKIGLCTDPADRPEAEKAIVELYAAANLTAPRVVWCLSPVGSALTKATMVNMNELIPAAAATIPADASPRDMVTGLVKFVVVDYLVPSVSESVWNSADPEIWDQVMDEVKKARKSKKKLATDAVDKLRAAFISSASDMRQESIYGQHDAGWAAFYTYLRVECGLVEETEPLTGLLRLCRSANWALPYSKICWVSERHNIVKVDTDGRLHCPDGPALAYPDGWSRWYINGVAVDEQIVMRPETQTIEQIHGDDNTERRRVRIERYGWERYLDTSGSVKVHARWNERDQQQEILYKTPDGRKRIKVSDPSTGRKYVLGVPAEINDCQAAQDWMSHGLDRLAVHRS